MIVEAWSPARREAIEQRFGSPDHWSQAQGRAQWGRPTESGRWAETIVVIESTDDRPAAVASGFRSRIHADRDWCYVEVAPDVRGVGIGAVALAALQDAAPADVRPLRAKVAADSAGSRFAARHGLTPIQRTRTIRVTRNIDDSGACGIDAEVIGAGQVDDDVVDAWNVYYRDGHEWDPPGHLSTALGRELFFRGSADDVVVVRRRATIVGVGCVMRSDARPTFVGGSIVRDDPDAASIASALLYQVSRLTGPVGFDVELDDWMWEMEAALNVTAVDVVDTSFVVAEPW